MINNIIHNQFSFLITHDNKYYELTCFANREPNFFLRNEECEGMSISSQSLFDIFDKFFKENF